MKKFIIKKMQTKPLQKKTVINNKEKVSNMKTQDSVNNTKSIEDKIAEVSSVLDDQQKVKRIKKDKSIIERTESSKKILTEDNKELLID